jgi:hypothetical protein
MRNYLTVALVILTVSNTLIAESKNPRPIKIGVVTDVSGVGAYWGTQAVKGAEFAAEEIQSNGQAVSLVIEDAALQSSRAISAVQKLIDVDHVDALFVEFTPHIVPALPTITSAKIPTIYVAGAESPVEKSPYVFKLFQSYVTGCRDAAKNFIQRGLTPIGVLTAQAEYGELCLKGIKEATSEFISIEYTRGAIVHSEVLTLKQKGVKSIINAGFEADTINTLQSMAKIDFHVPIGGGKEDLLTDKVVKEFGGQLTGSIGFALPELSEPFEERLRAYLLTSQTALTQPQALGQAYAVVKFLHSALIACPPHTIECVTENLKKTPAFSDIGFEGFDTRRIGIFKQRIVVQQ